MTSLTTRSTIVAPATSTSTSSTTVSVTTSVTTTSFIFSTGTSLITSTGTSFSTTLTTSTSLTSASPQAIIADNASKANAPTRNRLNFILYVLLTFSPTNITGNITALRYRQTVSNILRRQNTEGG